MFPARGALRTERLMKFPAYGIPAYRVRETGRLGHAPLRISDSIGDGNSWHAQNWAASIGRDSRAIISIESRDGARGDRASLDRG